MNTWKTLLLATLLLCAGTALAQATCICSTAAGCQIASGPYPNTALQPATCTVYKAGVQIGSGAVVSSSTIPLSNAARCFPADPTYAPGPTGSVACLVSIPQQPVGTVTLAMTGTPSGGTESGNSAPFSFVSAVALLVAPSSLRVAEFRVEDSVILASAFLTQSQTSLRRDTFGY